MKPPDNLLTNWSMDFLDFRKLLDYENCKETAFLIHLFQLNLLLNSNNSQNNSQSKVKPDLAGSGCLLLILKNKQYSLSSRFHIQVPELPIFFLGILLLFHIPIQHRADGSIKCPFGVTVTTRCINNINF